MIRLPPALRAMTGKRRVPILMYHEVSPVSEAGFEKYTVTPHTFALQMAVLEWLGYQAITLDLLHEHWTLGHPLPPKPVVITFDDGFQGCADYAVPILMGHGFTATFYLVAGLIGGRSEWLRPDRSFDLPLMDWATVRAVEAAGFTLGSHTVSHPRLAELRREQCVEELRVSREILEAGLGRPVLHFAYPYGSYDRQVRDLTFAAGYSTACSVRIGAAETGDDLLALRRVPISGLDDIAAFRARLEQAMTQPATATRLRRGLTRRAASLWHQILPLEDRSNVSSSGGRS